MRKRKRFLGAKAEGDEAHASHYWLRMKLQSAKILVIFILREERHHHGEFLVERDASNFMEGAD